MRKLLLVLGLLAFAVFVGFCAGWGLLLVMNAVLPPFRPEDDDTLREFIPVALAYLTMAVTTLLVLVAGWRRTRRRSETRSEAGAEPHELPRGPKGAGAPCRRTPR